MRKHVPAEFKSWVQTQSEIVLKVAVVGGSSRDPEVVYLSEFFPDTEIFYFGIDNSHDDPRFSYLDL